MVQATSVCTSLPQWRELGRDRRGLHAEVTRIVRFHSTLDQHLPKDLWDLQVLIRIISTSRWIRMSPWPEPRVLKWRKSWLLIQKLMWMPGAQNLKISDLSQKPLPLAEGSFVLMTLASLNHFFVLSFTYTLKPLRRYCNGDASENPHRLATPYLHLSTECECLLAPKVKDINDCLSLQLFSTVLILAWFL